MCVLCGCVQHVYGAPPPNLTGTTPKFNGHHSGPPLGRGCWTPCVFFRDQLHLHPTRPYDADVPSPVQSVDPIGVLVPYYHMVGCQVYSISAVHTCAKLIGVLVFLHWFPNVSLITGLVYV